MLDKRYTVCASDGRSIGFTEQMQSGGFRGYCYRSGLGYGPFSTRLAAQDWVHEQHVKGPIARYSK